MFFQPGVRFQPDLLIACILVLSTCGPAWAQSSPPAGAAAPAQQAEALERRTMMAVRMGDEESIAVDGRLDEAIWNRTVPAADFIQTDPRNGAPATERTEVRIAYSRTALYMGVTCFDDEPTRLLRFQMRRDEGLPSDDRFMWVIDPFLTSQNGYFFETNPSGLMGDALLTPAGQNRQWDGIWTLRVQRSDIGWTFEVEIPFSTLNFDPSGTSWGVNFQRTVKRKNEESLWFGWARNQGLQRLANSGLLQGLNDNVSQGLGLDVRPYGLMTSEASPVTGHQDLDHNGKAGIDVFYSVTPGLRANFTVNTDFAQTDVDQRQVNLTQYSLFFPEKRTFFLEGASLFDFGTVPSVGGGVGGGFSRPVDNTLIPFFSRRIGLDARGNPQKVDYGVKAFGQIGRQDIGVLQVRTGLDSDFPGVPSEDFTVVRLKRRMLRQSYLGVMYTRRDAHASGPDALETAGADFVFATNRFQGSKQLSFGGFFLRTTNPFETGRNSAYSLRVDYPNDRWNAGMSYRGVQDFFNPAVGFISRNGYQRYNPYLNFSPRPSNNRYVRRMGFTSDVTLQTDMDNRYLSRIWNLTVLNVDLHSLDTTSFLVIPEYERLDRPFNIYPGVTLPIGSEYNFVRYRLTFQTANRRVVALNPTVEWGDFYSGTRQQVLTNLTVRARPGVIIYLSHEWNRVNLPEGRFETRLYSVTPEWQFNQWVSSVNTFQYDSISAMLGWQSRFRWILKPGNDLFVVYSHNWRNDLVLDRFSTINRRLASKLLYTLRF